LFLIDKSFQFSPKNEYKLVAERRAQHQNKFGAGQAPARREASKHLQNFDWRSILKIARTCFCPRAAAGGTWKEKAGWRLRRNFSKLPKSLKKCRLEPYSTKENFY